MMWKKLTLANEPGDIFINLNNSYGMMRIGDNKTRIWSGDTAAVSAPRVKSGDSPFVMLPFYAEVRETPEEILGDYIGRSQH